MTEQALPLLPTSVIGSYATPGWLWTAHQEIQAGRYGNTDVREAYDDACSIAILDQQRAGVDVITDGEMRRWYFVQSFYGRFEGLDVRPPLRTTGVYGYDSPQRYVPRERVSAPAGLGIVDEFRWTKAHSDRLVKATCPGPLTLTIHIQVREGGPYRDRLDLAWEFAETVNTELKGLVAAGATFIQIDEPSFAIIPGGVKDWVALYNRAVEGVDAKLALHVCFGNLGSRPRGKRRYAWMFPELQEARCDQFVLEFANREMKEIELWPEWGGDRELGAGVVDIKSFYVETPDDVAERIREVLRYAPAERVWVNPDCGFFQLPRWLAFQKLDAMVRGTKIVRRELTGQG